MNTASELDPLLVNEGENSDFGVNWLISGASRCLEPIDTIKLAIAGFADVAERVSGARVALDKALNYPTHSSEQSADTKRREWIERVQPTITFGINGCEIFGLSGNFCIGKGKTFIEAIDAAMSQTKEKE